MNGILRVSARLVVLRRLVLWCSLLLPAMALQADELIVSWGGGPQPHSDQHNRQLSVDYNFYQKVRSPRSSLSVGVSYMQLKTDADVNKHIEVFSIYPQLTLVPARESMRNFYFFVRALGPSYINNNVLGDRQQDKHFTFQDQVGFGYVKQLSNSESLLLQLSWKHLSNGNLFKDNQGFDFPLVFSLGLRY